MTPPSQDLPQESAGACETGRPDARDDKPGQKQNRLRQRITGEAARRMTGGSDARRAVFRAARRVAGEWVPDDLLPDTTEVCGEVHRRLDATGSLAHLAGDRFDALAAMVAVLATVRRNPIRHPEGDALDHTLQVFDRVYLERPFDEELLTAALVHDVGLAIDRRDAVAAAVEAIGELVTPRTRWLVESLPIATAYADGSLGHRGRRRLEAHPDFLDIVCLAEADRRSRVKGYDSPSLDEAVAILRQLEAEASDPPDACEEGGSVVGLGLPRVASDSGPGGHAMGISLANPERPR
jgi:hypothetical protein